MVEWRAATRFLSLVPTISIQWIVTHMVEFCWNLRLLLDIWVGSLADESYGSNLANNSYTNYKLCIATQRHNTKNVFSILLCSKSESQNHFFNSLTNHIPKLPRNPNSDFLNNKTFPQMKKHRQWGPSPPSIHVWLMGNMGKWSWILSSNPNLVP